MPCTGTRLKCYFCTMIPYMKRLSILLFLALGAVSCRRASVNNHDREILVSILPQKYFVEKITGDRFKVNVMVPPGANPENYEFTPSDLQHAADAEIYFANGYIEFERVFVPKIQSLNKNLKIIDLSKGVNLIKCSEEEEHEKHAGGIDPHIWLSPKEVKTQAKNILDAITAANITDSSFYIANYKEFIREIDSVDIKINFMLEGLKSRKFIIYHPSLSYFSRDYNLGQYSIEIEGKSPSPQEIKEMIDMAKRESIRKIFVQVQFDTHVAGMISKETGAAIIEFDPLASDWKENLLKFASCLTKPDKN